MPLTPSTSPTAALPADQSTTTGHLKTLGFFLTSAAISSAFFGRSERLGEVGCEEMNVDRSGVGIDAGESRESTGKYERIILSWFGVGGDSTTSRSNSRGGEVGLG